MVKSIDWKQNTGVFLLEKKGRHGIHTRGDGKSNRVAWFII